MEEGKEESGGMGTLHPFIKLGLSALGIFLIAKMFAGIWAMVDFLIGFSLTLLAYFGFIFCSWHAGRAIYQMAGNGIEGAGQSIKDYFGSLVSAEVLAKMMAGNEKKQAKKSA